MKSIDLALESRFFVDSDLMVRMCLDKIMRSIVDFGGCKAHRAIPNIPSTPSFRTAPKNKLGARAW